MTVYNINLGIGWASSGVEYAQAYRSSIFHRLGVASKFIFTDFFQAENIQHLTANLGFQDEDVIWLYSYFTDQRIAETTYTLEQLEQTFSDPIAKIDRQDQLLRYHFQDKDAYVTVFLRKGHDTIVQRVEYVSKGILIRKDYFSYTKVFSEYYAPKEQKAHLYRRVFFNEDGSIAYEENCDGPRSVFRIGQEVLYSKEELVAYFLDCLKLNSQDLILLDRATGVGQAVFSHKGKAKLAVVIHAEHYNRHSTDQDRILWNNYYEYQFRHADQVDAFITSTEEQKKVLAEQFAHYQQEFPRIEVLPVGSISQLRSGKRKPYSLMTGSRLAAEKHIDWLVDALVLAHETLPEMTFDIYGEGGKRASLKQQIEEAQATDYIRLMGHQDLTDLYAGYQVYLTASTSEGFGLTLLEAIGSGLALIGLDVPYGNQTFIQTGQNGYRIPRLEKDDSRSYAQALAEKIVALYQEDLENFHRASYERASEFLQEKLEKKWAQFLEEVLDDSII